MSTVVAIFAHPDDETFGVGGVLAGAAEGGARVVAVCATRGEVGEIAHPALATRETLGAVREAELRAASAELGFHDVRFLGFRDSGMAGTADNAKPDAFVNADRAAVVRELVRILREVRADAVITFEPKGGYGHPDHVLISGLATEAFDRAGDPGSFPESGPPHLPSALHYAAIPRSFVRRWDETLRAQGLVSGLIDAAGVERMGVPDEQITTTVDISPWSERKRSAIERHATQLSEYRRVPDEFRELMLMNEGFIQVRGEPAPAPSLAGVPLPRTAAR